MKYIVSAVLLLVIFAFGLAFSAHNELMVELNYFLAKGQFQLAHLLALAFIFGVVLTLSFSLFFYIKLRLNNRYLRARVCKLQAKLTQVAKNGAKGPNKISAPNNSSEDSPKLLEQS